MKWFATFGQGWSLRNNYVEFEAGSYEEAWTIMSHQYQQNWSLLYTEHAFDGQAKAYNLTKVKFGTENVYAPGKAPEMKLPMCSENNNLPDKLPIDATFNFEPGDGSIVVNQGAYGVPLDPPDETTPERLDTWHPEFLDKWRITPLIGNKLLIGKPPVGPLTKFEAMLLAAWLCHEAEKLDGDLHFGDVLNVVEAIDGK